MYWIHRHVHFKVCYAILSRKDVKTIRSVLRFLLGNLHGLCQSEINDVDVNRLEGLNDLFVLYLLTEFVTNTYNYSESICV